MANVISVSGNTSNTLSDYRGGRAVQSQRTRARGRGATPEERKRSRAAFKGWDTRLANRLKQVRVR